MKRYIFISTVSFVGVVATSSLSPVGAQAALQGANSGLQTQTQQTQRQSGNNLNQTGSLQNNSGTILNQNVKKPLGVVSSPAQTNPDASVPPSSTLKTDVTKQDDSVNALVYVAAISTLIVVIGVYLLQRGNKPVAESVVPEEKPVIKPEPLKAPKKTRAPRKKNKTKKK